MSRLDIPPTKSSLLTVRKGLTLARDGFELLDQKRRILLIELMGRVAAARTAQQEVAGRMAKAFDALRRAELTGGSQAVAAQALAARADHEVTVRNQRLMGINLPAIEAHTAPAELRAGFATSPAAADEAMGAFTEALGPIVKLAEIENAVFRLARELKKTQRRVNALEKRFIPQYEATAKYIEDVLEERERDHLVILRMIRDSGRAAP
jgi:V/A-type H+-transporting ATPase subunit D